MEKNKQIILSGKRKRAIAKASIKKGKGKISINKLPYENLSRFHFLSIKEPLDIAKKVLGKDKLEFDIEVKVKGGGAEGQIEASRLAIGKALVEATGSQELRKALTSYDKSLLVADVRRKEPNKPGDSKARAHRQSSKR